MVEKNRVKYSMEMAATGFIYHVQGWKNVHRNRYWVMRLFRSKSIYNKSMQFWKKMIVQLFHIDRNHIGEFLTQIRESKIRKKREDGALSSAIFAGFCLYDVKTLRSR